MCCSLRRRSASSLRAVVVSPSNRWNFCGWGGSVARSKVSPPDPAALVASIIRGVMRCGGEPILRKDRDNCRSASRPVVCRRLHQRLDGTWLRDGGHAASYRPFSPMGPRGRNAAPRPNPVPGPRAQPVRPLGKQCGSDQCRDQRMRRGTCHGGDRRNRRNLGRQPDGYRDYLEQSANGEPNFRIRCQ